MGETKVHAGMRHRNLGWRSGNMQDPSRQRPLRPVDRVQEDGHINQGVLPKELTLLPAASTSWILAPARSRRLLSSALQMGGGIRSVTRTPDDR